MVIKYLYKSYFFIIDVIFYSFNGELFDYRWYWKTFETKAEA